MYLSIAEHIVQTGQRLRRAGKDYQTANRTVQAMYYAQEYRTRLLIFLLDVVLHNIREGTIASLVSLYASYILLLTSNYIFIPPSTWIT